jgi:DDE family transposase
MGEGQNQGLQLSFNPFLRVAFQGSRVTSDGGLILVPELDERLGFSELIEQHLTDSRANNSRFSFADLLWQSVFSRLAGYEDVNHGERVSHDPAFRLIGSEKIWDRGAALISRLLTFETEMLARKRILRVWHGSTGNSSGKQKRWVRLTVQCWPWIRPGSRCTGSNSKALTTETSNSPANSRCCCSIEKGTVWRQSSVLGMFTAPRVEKNGCCRRSIDSSGWGRRADGW